MKKKMHIYNILAGKKIISINTNIANKHSFFSYIYILYNECPNEHTCHNFTFQDTVWMCYVLSEYFISFDYAVCTCCKIPKYISKCICLKQSLNDMEVR